MESAVQMSDSFVFFWSGWPSQWHPSSFTIGGVSYSSAEQYMMAEKARFFGDWERERSIMAAVHPREQKALGRAVRGFDQAQWELVCRGVVYEGNLAKFGQDQALRELLLATGDREMVEASPFDQVWGIGLRAEDPRAHDPAQWLGRNWLGFALMQVRGTIKLGAESAAGQESLEAELREQLERLRVRRGFG